MTEALEAVRQLVKDFKENEAFYHSPEYPESRARQDFIDKFFTALGWDVTHTVQKNPHAQEVQIENRVATGTSQRRADYAFHIAPNFHDVKFFAEAKKPTRNLFNADYYYQTIRYGWNTGTPLAVLTDFEELHIIDCRYKPDIATVLDRQVMAFRYEQYADEEQFAKIFYLIGRDEVAKNSLEKYVKNFLEPPWREGKRGKFKRRYEQVDEAFLGELDGFRETLAKAFKKANQDLEGEDLTEAVQRTIDRLVFIRFLEDKGIEEKEIVKFGSQTTPFPINREHPSSERRGRGVVSEAIQDWGRGVSPVPSVIAAMQKPAWSGFLALCKRLEPKYNGLVFKPHRILESKEFHPPDDNQFAGICGKLADPSSPYDFNQIPISILGSIYERFLGKVVHATAKRVSIEEKPEVRKAGGVYYTPQYIVRYIVNETVGKLIQDKTPKEISAMAFADIACGSGSFLIEVYSRLLAYHVQWYVSHPEQIREGDTYDQDGKLYLTLKKKKEILLNNVYGVDIDSQATEVTQLSLYLKLLEDVSLRDAHQYGMFKETILPDLQQNIVSGNSLIGTDILGGNLFDDGSAHMLKPMDFVAAFPNVMKRGGFDAVVGNPPYLGGREWKKENGRQYSYFVDKYAVAEYQFDMYVLFLERGVRLLKSRGSLGFITPNTWLNNQSNLKLREFILDSCKILSITDYSRVRVFRQAVVLPIIVVLKREDAENHRVDIKIPSDGDVKLSRTISQNLWKEDQLKIVNIDLNEIDALIKSRIEVGKNRLDSLSQVKFGIKLYETGKGTPPQRASDAVIHAFESRAKLDETSRRYLEGKDINRYQINWQQRWLKYGPNLAAPRDPILFEGDRLLLRRIVGDRLIGTCTNDDFVTSQLLQIVKPFDPQLTKYLLGILNSSLIAFYFRKKYNRQDETFPEIRIYELSAMPIRTIDFNDPADKARHDAIVKLVERMLAMKKELAAVKNDGDEARLELHCAALDREIDQAVYELYGLTEEEIRIVEGESKTQA
jgi:type I restriction-modification system DNA methylase subunit